MSLQQLFINPNRGFYSYDWDTTTGVREDTYTFYELDGVIKEDHRSVVKLTQHPVEYGAKITDHAIRQPMKVTVNGVITNTPLAKQLNKSIPGSGNILDQGTSSFKGARIQGAYKGLVELQNLRWPMTLQTGLLSYENMVLTELRTPNDIKNRLNVTMVFEEVILPGNLNTTTSSTYSVSTSLDSSSLDYLSVVSSLGVLGLSLATLGG